MNENSTTEAALKIMGAALAGHAARVEKNPKLNKKAPEYDNPLTDFVLLCIAEAKATEKFRLTSESRGVD